MFSDFKNQSFKNRLHDRWQSSNKSNIFLLIKNYNYYYLKNKIFNIKKFKHNNSIPQIKKNSIIIEIGIWKSNFSKEIFDNCKPKKLNLADIWKFNKDIKGCALQVKGKEPLNQAYFDQDYNETAIKLDHCSNFLIYKSNYKDGSKKFEDNFFVYIYIYPEHSNRAVQQDLECWLPKLKKNGYILVDDYDWREEDYSLSVERAYQEFFKINDIKFWCVFKSQTIFIK